ncbi:MULTISPECIES: DUF4160 domain-containing protein [unclassified Campylobacter]|uniref:DUF4160 domain-containing protein n=1 Tax=unclassified Campylobacter TaxID=2593542 RepID=UPI0022EA00D3|nr:MULTISPECIES: DUF4160 domain-containing protein [unclassified Campylobacter]MDA3054953.1 DUF4160 domain-containing protein [Campylobacter sp. VBCF_07 NA4]MDA3060455.1 DUF4160 domain-containing protein [Campylobacter sp. VBCF_02 NA5]MDA3070279.1 DUF4160 domain-containing protein [Campylobacter sp. VBCF_08 NA3]WBR54710.1 DUF4160 domain-containing protein [Campylobacter sp. VBCF_01 NA2]
MPTLLKLNGFKFFFYSNEHEPKHIHILKGDEYAKINLIDLSVYFSSFKNKDLDFALQVIKEHRAEFERIWDEYFN